jgi:hypothetical protein
MRPGSSALPVLVLLPLVAVAGSPPIADPAPLLRALEDENGWVVHKKGAKGGVDVYRKKIPGQSIPAFKGEKTVECDSTTLFEAIIDIAHHVGLSKDIPLVESRVLQRSGNTIDFWQYLDTPGWTLANDRYWFARATIYRDLGGTPGRHRQTWERIDETKFPDAVKAALARDDDAVLTPMNVGYWEVLPLGEGKTKLIYKVLSDPGGSLPDSAASLATGTTLPDNLLQFEAAGKRR